MKACPKCGSEYPDSTTLCPADGIALEKTDDSLIGQTLAGKYKIEDRLSEGGMGTVYRGTHVLMDKTVAIKVLRPSLAADEKIVARFSREARAASRILHPHALSVTDFGEDENGTVFLVMEYLSGKTLKDVIRNEGPMPLPRVVEIIKQIGSALDEAHGQGVVHRDLKSDNIMLIASMGAADYAKVLDFGIAKIKEPEGQYNAALTSPDLVIGTPQYMSPEQCSQAPDIDARSDIYSLGVIIYEMLVGHVPFTGESPTAIMMKHLQQPAPSVLVERSDLPAGVGKVVARALEKRPESRYETVGQLVDDLTIAAGMASGAYEAPPVTARTEPDPSGSYSAVEDDDDEETLVRRRVTTQMAPPPPPVDTYSGPPPSSFNPWKVLIPSMIGLLLVFGVIYALTRNSGSPTPVTPAPTLAADPNSQPVEPATPPTGSAEVGIPAGGLTTQDDANLNSNANISASPSPTEDTSTAPNVNLDDNSNANDNTSKAPPIPTATRTTIDAPPAPSPRATNPPVPKPTVPAPDATPPGVP